MTNRTVGKVAGWAYLLYIACAMSGSMLLARAAATGDVTQTLSTFGHRIGMERVTVLLDLGGIVCALTLAATLYQLVKAVDPTIALLAMLFRLGEGLLGFLPLQDKLELMHFATTPALSTAASADPELVREVMLRPNNGFGEFCFVVGGFLFAVLFLRGQLIPRWLAWVGVATIGVQLICVPLSVATLLPTQIVDWLWLPILLYEVPLGIWLIVRGVGDTGTLRTHAENHP